MLKDLGRVVGRPLALALVLMGLWLLLSGYFEKPTLLAFGVASVLLTTWLADRAGVLDGEGVPTRVFPGILGYMLWLTLEIGKANIAVAREVIRPKLKLSPKMLMVTADQASELGKTIFGNSITLTPGTVTVDLQADCILVHALTEDLADVDAIEDMGQKVCAFDGDEGRAWAKTRRRASKGEGAN